MRYPATVAALACAAALCALPGSATAAGEPHPTIPVPDGWKQTHTGDGDTTWKRDGEQLHVKQFAFAGTLDELVTTLAKGMKAEEADRAELTVTPVTACGGTLKARRVVVSAGAGADRAVAEMIAAVDGKTAYAATYLRLASEPDRPEARAALLGLCITT